MSITDELEKEEQSETDEQVKAKKVVLSTEMLPKYKQFIRSVGASDIPLMGGGMIFSAQSVDMALQGWFEKGYHVFSTDVTFVRKDADVPEHYNIYYLLELQE